MTIADSKALAGTFGTGPDPVAEEDAARVVKACRPEFQTLGGATLLLTGGTGFIGSTLLESFRAWNQEHPNQALTVLLPTRSLAEARRKWPRFFDDAHLKWFQWDARSLPAPGDEVEYLIHGAGTANAQELSKDVSASFRAMVETNDAVVQFAAKHDVRHALFLSSGAVYRRGSSIPTGIREDAPTLSPDLDSVAGYGEAKSACENRWKDSGVPAVAARLFTFVGPYQDPSGSSGVMDLLRQATHTSMIRLRTDGSAVRTYAYSADLTIALVKLLMRGLPGEAYNVGAGPPGVSILELARLVAEAAGKPHLSIQAGPRPDAVRPLYVPDVSKLAPLAPPATPLPEALRRTLRSMTQRALLPGRTS